MNVVPQVAAKNRIWQWPNTGPTPVNYGLDSEIFDSEKFPHIQTFVREAIQNSLDARLDKQLPVRVKFAFHQAPLANQESFLGDLEAKKLACGLQWPEDWGAGKASWLLVEDSNTSGLEGDLSKRTSDFWNYWLNFGISNKDGKGRGGRGIGRITFLIASQINTVIGVTRRAVDGKLATCGMSLLKPVEHANDFKSSYAYLARNPSGSVYELYDDVTLVQGLMDAFEIFDYQIQGSSGFSLIIPYPHKNLTSPGLIAAAIEHFGPAIMTGSLVVEVDGEIVDEATIDGQALRVIGHFSSPPLREDPVRVLDLARRSTAPAEFILPISDTSIKLTDNLDEGTRNDLRAHFEQNGQLVIGIDVPVTCTGTKTLSRIQVAMSQTPKEGKPVDLFFREGMCLPEVVARNPADVDLVVQSNEGSLVAYLNFCEGKAHLGLIENQDVAAKLTANGFDARFHVKRFVRKLMDDLRSLVLPDASKPDSSVFSNFFSAPSSSVPKTKKKVTRKSVVIPDPPEPKTRIFVVDDLPDGFRIRSNPQHSAWPVNLKAEVAYADGSRKPGWSRHDFQLQKLPIESTGGSALTFKDNTVSCRDCGPDFSVEIRGFDRRRELVTNVRATRNA